MKDRTGESWELEGVGRNNVVFLVVGPPARKGSDHHNPNTILWIHPCVNLETGVKFEAREWTDEFWEDRKFKKRIA